MWTNYEERKKMEKRYRKGRKERGGNVKVGRKGMRGSDARKDRERNQRKARRNQNQPEEK